MKSKPSKPNQTLMEVLTDYKPEKESNLSLMNTSKFEVKGNAIRFKSNGRRVGYVKHTPAKPTKNPKLFMLRTDIVETSNGIYGIVTNRKGFQFAVTYAPGTSVTREKIALDWYENRRDFQPYDWCKMQYCTEAKAMHDL